jgi:uncharacterized delta-60 repeat protein
MRHSQRTSCALACAAIVLAAALADCGGGSSGSPPPGAGTLDTTFGIGGIVATADRSPLPGAAASAVAVQEDGLIVVAGSSSLVPGPGESETPFATVARYNTNGTFDSSFGIGGTLVLPVHASRFNAGTLQPDGKFVVAGTIGFAAGTPADQLAQSCMVARIDANGSLDATFGTGGMVVMEQGTVCNSVALQADGRIVAVGKAFVAGACCGNSRFLLVRLNADGSRDPSLGEGAGEILTTVNEFEGFLSVILDRDGKILAGGGEDGGFHMTLARYDGNGTLDPSFGERGVVTASFAQGSDGVRGIALQSDGRIVGVGDAIPGRSLGLAPLPGYFAMVRFLPNGVLDSSFGDKGLVTIPGKREARGVALDANGKIVAVANSDKGFLVTRFNADGSPDVTFGEGGAVETPFASQAVAQTITIQPDGRILVGGATGAGASSIFALARYVGG